MEPVHVEEVERLRLKLVAWGFFVLLFFIIWLLVRREKLSFRELFAPDTCTTLAFILFLLAAPAYFFCLHHHYCMAGHGLHFDGSTPYLMDVFWQSAFIACIVLSFCCDIRFRYALVYSLLNGLLFLCDPMGLLFIFSIPLVVVCSVFWIACLLDWID